MDMTTNCKIVLTESQRDRLASILDGKDNCRLATRKEICRLAADYVMSIADGKATGNPELDPLDEPAELPAYDDMGHGELIAALDEAERANALLRSRINTLQHRLDTMRK